MRNSTCEMLTIFPTGVENDFHFQRTFVGLDLLSLAYKYVSIPLDENFKGLTQVIPKSDIHHDFGFANWTVLQYSSLNGFSSIEKKLSQSVAVSKKSIRTYNGIVDAKEIEISLVLSRSQAIGMWKTNSEIQSLLKNILSIFFVSQSSIILVPERCFNQNCIKYICVHNTGSKKSVSRVTDNTLIKIRDLHSVTSFEFFCTERNAFRIEALDHQIAFLDFVYDAHLQQKCNKASPKTKIVQKILLSGPSGCGKTRMVKHFAELKKCGLVVVEMWRMDHLPVGKIEKTLSAYFSEAVSVSKERDDGVCILLLDEIESLCREKRQGSFLRRGFSFMIGRFLEIAEEYPGLIIIATTNNIGVLHSHIRCAGKMEVELHIGPPTEQDRFKILQMYCNCFKMPASICSKVANFTPGFFGADLNSLVCNVARIRNLDLKLYRHENDLLNLFKKLILKSPCLSLRCGLGVSPTRDIEMKHLGGLESAKRCLKSFVEWPLLHSEAFHRLGLPFPRGILLYGPPGCAKTSLAKAIARSLNINFLFVSAAELYSAFVGEAEKNVVTLFDKARLSRPCIIFIDEIDTLAGNRNTPSKNVQSKILSTFLTEMDGVGNKLDVTCINKVINDDTGKKISNDCIKNVIVIAATNRPDKLDSALLRPGRFDKLIFVGPPSLNERVEILDSLIKHSKMPVSAQINFAEVANKTDDFTGADLKLLLKEAGYAALLRDTNAHEIVPEDLTAALQLVKPSSVKKYLNLYESFQ